MLAIGVDCTSGRQTFTYAALDAELRVVSLTELEAEQIFLMLEGAEHAVVAVNSPSHLNAGVMRRRLQAREGSTGSTRGSELREAEFDLHRRGISVGSTPRLEALAPAWVRLGLTLFQGIERVGFRAFPQANSARQWLETHPHAGFCVLLGRQPLPKPSLEGRLQRALALFERGVRISDPMAFLEEITRHRLLHGVLPIEQLPTQEQLDALLAAYTAWLAIKKPDDVTQVGNRQEGFITLPAGTLQDQYLLV